ncbi:MAG: TatD family hydrolase [Candidatus Omnitrophica bacterium]|nr:TatD family hydrolase [Candidatus Omnitrophota bacterium]
MFIDTHCHLDFPEFDQDRDAVVKNARDQGIEYIVNIGSSLEGSLRSLDLTRKYPQVYATVGIHPHEADSFNEKVKNKIETLAKEEKVVGIGEIGLDYYLPAARLPDGQGQAGRNFSKAQNQQALFLSMIGLAKDCGLPMVIHCRQAQDEVLKILKDAMPIKAVIHCFSGDENFLKECLSLGFFISYTCNITYKKAEGLRSLVGATPLEKVFLETDAPYLSPEGLRGRRNEPLNVRSVAEEISRIKKISVDEVAQATTANAKEFFNLK